MDSTPPSRRSRPRLIITSSSRLSRLTHSQSSPSPTPRLSLDLVASPKITAAPSPSPSSPTTLPIRELLLLSPSPLRKSKTRLADRLVEAAEEPPAIEPVGSRRKCKNRNGSMGVLVCGSPRNGRRLRRRLEPEVVREERDSGVVEEVSRGRKRRNSGRSKKDKLGSVPSIPSPRVSFSIFTLISQLGLLFLGLSFFSSSIYQRVNEENKREFKLEEDDILRVARVILPPLHLAISKTRELFSGEPTMTLLKLTKEEGVLYKAVECLKRRVLEAWRACSHKKIVAASIATAFWNLTSIRTRIFAAFIFVVILRYNRQHLKTKVEVEHEEEEVEEAKEGKQEQKALVVVENGVS
ncbi:hypothetical protein RHGRI_011468 [Rhododendron griersonianum]|uniref:Reticulon domain-containing protein n=1 Tax=Rhododendron griersonianum TaxID=479676 RepID=A0AAV6KN01_9ERIC|nr:hypothetical protein RHGRI_011468 [Rhododendron griersonianum]